MTDTRQRLLDFSRWLRTGRWVPAQLVDPQLEVKFNPYHDPTNGQFTFAPGGSTANDARDGQRRSPPGQNESSTDPRHPTNYRLHTVKRGDTLQRVAATRVGLSPADLRWLNGMKNDRLIVGQQLKVPTQESLDAGKRALDTFVALNAYIGSHAGRLPPDPAHPPSPVESPSAPLTSVHRDVRRPSLSHGQPAQVVTRARSTMRQEASNMNESKFSSLGPAFNAIGQEVIALAGPSADHLFLYVEIGEGWQETSLYRDEGNRVSWVDYSPDADLFDLITDAWCLEPADKRWTAMEYVVDKGSFTATFGFDDLEGSEEDEDDRRERVLRARYGDKPVYYPPMPAGSWNLTPPS